MVEKVRAVILPDLAMVCMRSKCEVIFEGPDRKCPLCGWQGAPYREIEAIALSATLGVEIKAPKQTIQSTLVIQ
jgi:hypothetical protein